MTDDGENDYDIAASNFFLQFGQLRIFARNFGSAKNNSGQISFASMYVSKSGLVSFFGLVRLVWFSFHFFIFPFSYFYFAEGRTVGRRDDPSDRAGYREGF